MIIISQVDQVLTIEELFPYARRRYRTTYKEVYPNRKGGKKEQIRAGIDFMIWGGDHYDNREGIDRALPSSTVNLLLCDYLHALNSVSTIMYNIIIMVNSL